MNNRTKIEIEIDTKLYDKLANHTIGFESPSDVINRLTNFYEENCDIVKKSNADKKKPTIHFIPNNEIEFKNMLLDTKQAWRAIIKNNDSVEIQKWNASRFTEQSNLQANLWSGILRNWKDDEIKSVILSIEQLPNDRGLLAGIINSSIPNQELSTRGLANIWLTKRFPDILTKGFKSSKYFPEKEEWFFTIDESIIEKEGNTNLLLSIPSEPKCFHLLSIPNNTFLENQKFLKKRELNKKKVFDLHISGNSVNWLATKTATPIDLSNFLV